MDYTSLPLFSLLHTKMHYLGQRQATIAQNIANVDTPAFKAQDVKAPEFARMVGGMGQLTPARTHPMHLSGAGMATSGMFKQFARPETAETHPNGNNVSLEEEVKNLSLTQSDYGQAVTLYHKNIALFKTALGVGGATA